MRITELETIVVQQPGPLRVIEDSIHRIASGRDLIVRLHTEGGIYGTYTLSIAGYGGELTRQLFEVEMRRLVVGQDASMPRRLRRRLFDQTEYYGVSGLGVFGISVIDYWCQRAIDAGYGAVKIKVGAPDLADDLRRLETVRNALGPDIHIMVDANQIHPVDEAIRRGNAYEPYDIYWYEEPLRPWMNTEYGELRAAVSVPIATGENIYGKHAVLDLLEKRGVMEIMEMAALADAYNVRIATAFDIGRLGKGNAIAVITVIGIFVVLIPFLWRSYRDQIAERT